MSGVQKIKIAVSILLAAGLVLFIIFYGQLKDELLSEEVVVVHPDAFIQAKEVITSDDLLIVSRRKSDLVDGVVYAHEIDQVIGQDAATNLYGNMILSHHHVDYDQVIPDPEKGEAIRPIPNEWIFAKPGSLRRKDQVQIYILSPVFFSQQQDVRHMPPLTVDDLGELGEWIELRNPGEHAKLILENVVVVYAKDPSNNEVTGDSDEDKRLTASGRISDLEVILNEEDFQKLIAHIEQGYKLYITYY